MPGIDQGTWAAPGRLNLIGEHTDYNDGFVLPFALAQRTTVTARRVPGSPQWSMTSTAKSDGVRLDPADLVPGRVTGWAGYVAGVIWALIDAGYDLPGVAFTIDSTVPLGAGLSSSAALECAVLAALNDLGDLDIPMAARPALAQRAENVFVGMPCGIMDQTASTLCSEGHLLYLDCRSNETAHIPCDFAVEGLAVLVIDTRAPHRHVDNEYAERRRSCEEAASLLGLPALRDVSDLDAALALLPDAVMRRRVRHVVTENARVQAAVERLRAEKMHDLGPLLTESHVSMRDDYEISVSEVDCAVDVALASGAYGARMTGGGFGGCVLALVDAESSESVASAVSAAFAARGFAEPSWFLASPSSGACRVL